MKKSFLKATILIIALFLLVPAYQVAQTTKKPAPSCFITATEQGDLADPFLTIDIVGRNFGTTRGSRKVYIANREAPMYLIWDDYWIRAAIPSECYCLLGKPLPVYIKEKGRIISNTVYEKVLGAIVVKPNRILYTSFRIQEKLKKKKVTVSIEGEWISCYRGKGVVTFKKYRGARKYRAKIIKWDSKNNILVEIPKMPRGNYDVYIESGGVTVTWAERFKVI